MFLLKDNFFKKIISISLFNWHKWWLEFSTCYVFYVMLFFKRSCLKYHTILCLFAIFDVVGVNCGRFMCRWRLHPSTIWWFKSVYWWNICFWLKLIANVPQALLFTFHLHFFWYFLNPLLHFPYIKSFINISNHTIFFHLFNKLIFFF